MSCPVCQNQCCTLEGDMHTCDGCSAQWQMIRGPAPKLIKRAKYLVQQIIVGNVREGDYWVSPGHRLNELKEILCELKDLI